MTRSQQGVKRKEKMSQIDWLVLSNLYSMRRPLRVPLHNHMASPIHVLIQRGKRKRKKEKQKEARKNLKCFEAFCKREARNNPLKPKEKQYLSFKCWRVEMIFFNVFFSSTQDKLSPQEIFMRF